MVATNLLTGISWVSWGSIIAGTLTALALWLVMGLIGLALGFKVLDPTSDQPAAGLGKTVGIWAIVVNVVSFAGGGFLAGYLAGQRGPEHGFLVWAIVAIIMAAGTCLGMAKAARGASAVARGIGRGASGLAGAAHSLGSNAAHGVVGAASQLKDSLNIDFDPDQLTEKLNDNVVAVLRDTGSETLQPEYLKDQLNEARRDFQKLVRRVALNPSAAGDILTTFLDKEKARLQDLTGDIDQETAVTTLMNNRAIPRDEAETLVDNAVQAYNQTLSRARQAVADAKEQIQEIKDQVKTMADQARVKADQMTNSLAKAAGAAAIGLVLAALISIACAHWGVHCVRQWHPQDRVVVIETD